MHINIDDYDHSDLNDDNQPDLYLTNPDDKALKAGLDQIYDQSLTGIGGHFAALLLWTYILLDVLPKDAMLLLFIPQALVLLGRTILVRRYINNRHLIKDISDLHKWRNLFSLGASLTGLVWGASFFIITDLARDYHFIFFALMISLTVAGVTTLGAVFQVFLAYMLPILGVSTIWLFLQDGFLYNFAAIWCLYAISFTFMTVKKYSDGLKEAIIEKEIAHDKQRDLQIVTKELGANIERFNRWKESNFIGIIQIKSSGKILSANKTILELLGYSSQDVENQIIDNNILTPDEFIPLDKNAIQEAIKIGYWTPYEKEYLHKDGRRIPVLIGGSIFHKDNQEFIIFIVDLTEAKQQEEKIRRSQKMDALGKLTGGIAHDFNNMLGVIQGYSELLINALENQPKLEKYAVQINNAGKRGENLTKKILSFSRSKSDNEEVVFINSLLEEQQQMMEKTITVRIKLIFNLAKNLWPVFVNKNDLEDVILNICINAMHAMEDSSNLSQLTITAINKQVFLNQGNELGIRPGDYILLSFTDTGIGMDQHTKEKIFDPFYSTKGSKGTGLGLSQAFGFMKSINGTIKVYSEPELGSKFELYLPRYTNIQSDRPTLSNVESKVLSGNEKILIVDDEKSLLDLANELLVSEGYQTFLALNAHQALLILEKESIDLMLTDIIMPGMDGYQLSAKVEEQYPDIKILLASGFTGKLNPEVNDPGNQYTLISKPYLAGELLNNIRNILDKKQ